MTLPHNATREARIKHNASNTRSKRRLAARIRARRLYLHALEDPDYYMALEQRLHATLPDFALDVAPDRTIATWRTAEGLLESIRNDTRAGTLLAAWCFVPPEF